MKMRGVLFDKDGTLISFDESWEESANLFIEKLHKEYRFEQIVLEKNLGILNGKVIANSPLMSGTYNQIYNHLRKMENSNANTVTEEWVSNFFYEYLIAHYDKIVPVGNLKKLLEYLHSIGIYIGLATSDNLKHTLFTLETLGIRKYFDFIGTGDYFQPKPEAEVLESFAKCVDIFPNEIIVVGDSMVDIELGNNHGLKGIGVLTGGMTKELFKSSNIEYFEDIQSIPYQLYL